jgi:hypothetical protein
MRYLQFISNWKVLTKLGLLCMAQDEYDWNLAKPTLLRRVIYANGFVDV